MIEQIKKAAETKMQKSITSLSTELAKLRTGRAHPSLLEHVMVSYYGTDTPISQIASVHVGDARTLLVTPWEKALVPDVEKAIRNSNLGLNPAPSGDAIRVPLPALTEERRKEILKLVRQEGENSKVAIRNIRRDANNQCKDLLKTKDISEDEERKAETDIQKVTDKFIAEVDTHLQSKEKEIMEI